MAGAELEATLDLDVKIGVGMAEHDIAVAILAAGAAAVERLGAKRRRGNGRCCIQLLEQTVDFVKVFEVTPPQIKIDTNAGLVLSTPAAIGEEIGWHVIPLDLELLSPVVIPADTAGNVIATRDHIPGSMLLPALDKKLRTLLGDKACELTSHLAAGRIQIRNAYPCKDGHRLLPVPAALMAEKEAPGKIINELCGHTADGTQRKQLRVGYVPEAGLTNTGDDKSPLITVKTIATTHAVIDDRVQRPTADVGGVFTYEAIAPGQTFRTEIRIAKSVLANVPDANLLNGNLRIGRAKKDDYGLVKATASKVADGRAAPSDRRQFTLWLASPALIRDERLRPITDAHSLAVWLGKQLGVILKREIAFARSIRDDGWNNAWKEPRPTRFGLAAGSCFHFSATENITANKLLALETAGIGERRGEGYGEIRIDPVLLAKSQVPRFNPEPSKSPLQSGTVTATDFVRQLHERAWRIEIRRQALVKAESIAKEMGWQKSKPSNSQLGALRSLFEQWTGQNRLKSWLDHLKKTPNRKDKWPPNSLEILGKCAGNSSHVWSHLAAEELPVLTGFDSESLKQALTTEGTRIFWLTVIGHELDRRADTDKNKEGN